MGIKKMKVEGGLVMEVLERERNV